VTAAIETFLTGARGAPSPTKRTLRTVLFTDIVGSTEQAATLGDDRWRAVLERFTEMSAELTARFEGSVVKSTGDGFLATFHGPTAAIRCAQALVGDVLSLGVRIRAGIHTGECEILGEDVGGIAVHIAARVLSEAGPDEIVASSVVRDLVVGSGIGFADVGARELRGVPGTWTLVRVEPDGAATGSREARLVALPTPPPSSAMRRVDRVAGFLARRAPSLTRGAIRLAPRVVRD
jgi:class 3 adenylate cyclase